MVRSISKSEILIQLNIQISSIFLTGFCQLYCFINLKYKYLHMFPSIFNTPWIFTILEQVLFYFEQKDFLHRSIRLCVELIPHKNIYQIHFCYIYGPHKKFWLLKKFENPPMERNKYTIFKKLLIDKDKMVT